MKKRIATLLMTGIFFVTGIFFWTANLSSAQEKTSPESPTIIQKIDSLVTQLSKITDLITVEKKETVETEILKEGKDLLYTYGNPLGCGSYAAYDTWTQSYYRKNDANWSLMDHPLTYPGYGNSATKTKQLIDINGDGLVDSLAQSKNLAGGSGTLYDGDIDITVYSGGWKNYNYIREDSCLLLNNGAGWDTAYRCATRVETISGSGNDSINKMVYYGDCADTSKK